MPDIVSSPPTDAAARIEIGAAERDLVRLAARQGARRVPILSEAEEVLLRATVPHHRRDGAAASSSEHGRGDDFLGEALRVIRSPEQRRKYGATYTPPAIVEAMVARSVDAGAHPANVLDPGTGTGRFLLAAGQAFPDARLVGVEIDPVAALLARANLARAGLADRSRVLVGDLRGIDLSEHLAEGPTLHLGNPPYVRHHEIDPSWKRWLREQAATLGLRASGLAGLHVHFLLATALRLRPGDRGCLITSSEWLDVNYGDLPRHLFRTRLGGTQLVLLEPRLGPFPDAATTGVIICFEAGRRPDVVLVRRIARMEDLGCLDGGRPVARRRLERETRWTNLMRPATRDRPRAGLVELGAICRVHRGQVTGANRVWIVGPDPIDLPESVLRPAVTRARELIQAEGVLRSARQLRRVIDLPPDLDDLDEAERDRIETFLGAARAAGVDRGYVARHRRAWWSVGLREPAPILATYMARRPPVFVRNLARARHLNIAHGLYPRGPLSERALRRLVEHLSACVDVSAGRTYAGGLVKFEPREMERLLVPTAERLEA